MQKFITTILIISISILALLLYQEHYKKTGLESAIVTNDIICIALQKDIDALKNDLEGLRQNVIELKATNKTLSEAAEFLEQELDDAVILAEANTNATEESEGFMGEIANVLESPEMHETIKNNLTGQIILPIYGRFMNDLNLSVDDKDSFKDLLLEKYMSGIEMFSALQSGDKEQMKEMRESIEAAQVDVDTKIKELIGDTDFEQYEYLRDTEQERMKMNQMNQQLAYSDMALTPDQNEDIIEIMNQEKIAAQEDPDYFDLEKDGLDNLTEDKIDTLFASQAKIDDKVLKRAADILNAEQYKAFEEYQNNWLNQQMAGARMGLKMLNK